MCSANKRPKNAYRRSSQPGEIGTGKTLTVNCSASLIAAGIGSPIPLAYNIQENGIVSYLRKMAISGADF